MKIFRQFTCRSLKKNKMRTAVTIIGIMLSTALFVAVTASVSSLQNYMLRVTIEQDGCWHGMVDNIAGEDADKLVQKEEVESFGALGNIGYAKLEESRNEFRPYLFLGAYTGDFTNLLSVHITEGRLPENSSEIVIPKELQDNGGISYQIGEELKVETGVRKSQDGTVLWQTEKYQEDSSARESFLTDGEKTYRVVGRYTSADFYEDAAGYTALTKADEKVEAQGERLYITLFEPENTNSFLKSNVVKTYERDINSNYLTFLGKSQNKTIAEMMSGLLFVLIGIIMFGSVALIYNSFAISINERKKQYGLLSSVGATRKQLKRSILFESVVLSVIGIPLGILLGLGGIGVTFYLLRDTFSRFLNPMAGGSIRLTLSASVASVIIAGILGFVTVLISAWIPARRALRISAIEAIRQSEDIRVKPRQVRTLPWTQKLFGLGGVLASKNFKRNKKKYRATVFSLFISIVLFISASSFCDYMTSSAEEMIQDYKFDIIYRSSGKTENGKALYPVLAGVPGITNASYNITNDVTALQVLVPEEHLNKKYIEDSLVENDTGYYAIGVITAFVKDGTYEKYCSENGLDKEQFMNREQPMPIVMDEIRKYDASGGFYETYHILEQDTKPLTGKLLQRKKLRDNEEVLTDELKMDEKGQILCTIVEMKEVENGLESIEGSDRDVPLGEAWHISEFEIGAMAEQVPMGLDTYRGGCLIFLYPESALDTVCKEKGNLQMEMVFSSENPDLSYQKMCSELSLRKRSTDGIYNIYDSIMANRALLTVIRVFSYGFIVLISLIATANVFNTISTNMSLRRREFAMLRSVGMTQKGFYRMIRFECLLYGLKGLLYGLPVSIGITYLIYHVLSGGIRIGFYVPWYSIAIAVGSVFLVVFAPMMYSMKKISKDNVVETLKQETY
ncbi:MAG: ABC transporter permease [Lachnospiraceae bacterium]|nr:ABC transporter permease [Lachnospiraceae bacterium]